jgi:hypothetical protein
MVMRTLGKWTGILMFGLSGLYLWAMSILFMYALLGPVGVVIGIFVLFPPVDYVLPFVYWFITGQFPFLWFLAMVIGVAGMILGGTCMSDKTEREEYASSMQG